MFQYETLIDVANIGLLETLLSLTRSAAHLVAEVQGKRPNPSCGAQCGSDLAMGKRDHSGIARYELQRHPLFPSDYWVA